MISLFFINRPIFASVISIVTLIAGLIALEVLPIERYPNITPPTVGVTANYPGANAETVANTVASIIEQQVNGVEDSVYMSSTSTNEGNYSLTVTFEVGTDPNDAQVLVQNRVAVAQPALPEEVKRLGVITQSQSSAILMVLSLYSPEGEYDSLFLSNFATLRLRDELRRIPGVGNVNTFGAGDYSMRVWLDPEQLRTRSLTPSDVIQAVSQQNVQVAAGQIGAPPAPAEQAFQYTVNIQGRLKDPEEFGEIIVATQGDRIVRLKDVARIEVGARDYNIFCQQMGYEATGIAVFQRPESNALEVARLIRARMEQLSESFPPGLEYSVPYDTTMFVSASVEELTHTLIVAAILVFLVIFLFLQDWRATLIPAVAIPVALIGTFAFMLMLGFSINMLTLFGLVLAIGIVVDDAIVVVENVWHHMETNHLDAKEATVRAMQEISGPVIAITLVLMSVFIPTAFLPGITGQMYRQFAVTIAVSTGLSAINALTLSPALCAIFLREPKPRRFPVFRAFNWTFGKIENGFTSGAGLMLRKPLIVMLVYLPIAFLAGRGFTSLPTAFLPTEDQGFILIAAQLPDASSLSRTHEVVDRMNEVLKETEGISGWITFGGFSFLNGGAQPNSASIFAQFEPWEEREDPSLSQQAIVATLGQRFSEIRDANIITIIPPSITGLGLVGGFQMMLEDQGGLGMETLAEVINEIVGAANQQPTVRGVYSTLSAAVPQLFVNVDRTMAQTLGIPLPALFSTLQAFLGSVYIDDFIYLGRTFQVRAQAEPRFRLEPEDIRRLEVRNAAGEMIPVGTVATVERTLGPQVINRYNMYPAASISGNAAPGFSSGQALEAMENLARTTLPSSMGIEWTGMSFQERQVGNTTMIVFALAVLAVVLVLAAQYESWTNPVAVILVVPLALLGTVIALLVRDYDNNVYTQIGVVLIIALASKNAILIVEFARDLRAKGEPLKSAALRAAKLRFRPIVMTSLAFILGIYPLVVATGAAAASRRALGTAVFGGMIAATVLAVFFVPVFYVVFQGLGEWASRVTSGSKTLPEPREAESD